MGLIKGSYTCSLTLAMDIAGGKWKMVILWHLRNGTLRFTELKRLLDGITQKMLTQQLRELEESGLITRKVYPVVPPKVEYTLHAEGQKLLPALEALCTWSSAYAATHGIADASGCSSHALAPAATCSKERVTKTETCQFPIKITPVMST